MKRHARVILSILAMLVVVGCSHAVSKNARQMTDPNLPARAIFSDPDAYKGKFVILGGVIINTTNAKDGTYIEVLEEPLDSYERPADGKDSSLGRFIAFYNGYLDAAVYAKGKEVTVAGELTGKRIGRIGEMEYSYPLIRSTELHIFDQRRNPPVLFGIGVGIGGRF